MSYKRWIIPEIDKAEINALAEESGFDPFVTLLCYSRGYTDPFSLDMFLSKEMPDLDPYAFLDMEPAVKRVLTAIEKGEKITIFGDYDCDGTTATALVFDFLNSLGAKVDYYIPSRKEGYGMSLEAVEKIAADGTKLILTVDNGIAANEEIERAKELGVDTVVTDHHLPQGVIPNAVAVIDPHREGNMLDFKDFAGVGVAFMLVLALSDLSPEKMLSRYGDLVALGTVADLMPIKAENRGIVAAGVRKLNISPNVGLKELIVSAGLEPGKITSTNLGYMLAPRINAAGRMGSAARAVKLMTSTDIREIQHLADELCLENVKRQETEKQITKAAEDVIFKNKLYNDRVIVLAGENWHEGVLGIAAGRLTEEFGKPVILLNISSDEDIAKGSARSVANFPLFEAISFASSHLIKFGGHDMAAGLSLSVSKLDEFKSVINEYAKTKEYPVSEVFVDLKLNPSVISLDLITALRDLEPYGTENSSPLFGLFGMNIVRIIPMGNGKHLRLILSKGDTTVAAVMFNKSAEDFPFEAGNMVDLVVSLQSSVYQGEEQINVLVKDVKIHGHNDDKVIKSFLEYEEFLSDTICPETAKILSFEREDMAEVYRVIKLGVNSFAPLMYHLKKYSFSKLSVILDTMEELGLIETTKGGFDRKMKLLSTSKVSLENSKIYLKLKALSVEV